MESTILTREQIISALHLTNPPPSDIEVLIIQIIAEKSPMRPDDLRYLIKEAVIHRENGKDLSNREFTNHFNELDDEKFFRKGFRDLVWKRIVGFGDGANVYINPHYADSLGVVS